MREVRIFVATPIAGPGPLTLSGQAAIHVLKVLRMRADDELTLFDGKGIEYAARITQCRRDSVAVEVTDQFAVNRESPLHTTLALAVARGERTDLAIQKATELGVTEIIPLVTSRTVVQLSGRRAEGRLTRWRRLAASACEQCGRNSLPGIHAPRAIDDWLHELAPPGENERRLVADPHGNGATQLVDPPTAKLVLLIGPEGGLTRAELESACARSFEAITLGPRILRAETAVIALLGIVQWQFGDLAASR